MLTRADPVFDARLEDVGLRTLESDLPAPHVISAVLPEPAIPTAGRLMVVGVAPVPVAHCADLAGEGASHGASAIARVNRFVTGLAGAGRAGQLRTEDAYQP